MKIEITDEMLRKSFRAYQRDGWMRDALEAVAPIIANEALERAAELADDAQDFALSRRIRALKEPTNA